MLAITLDEDELNELKLLLRDIELIQKLNKPFDYSAINILSYIIDSINKKEDYSSQTEISDEEIDEFIRNTVTLNPLVDCGIKIGCQWYREQLKSK